MSENLPLDSVFAIVDLSTPPSETNYFVKPSFNQLRGAWFACDTEYDVVEELSDELYTDSEEAIAHAKSIDDDYISITLTRALMEALILHSPPKNQSTRVDGEKGSLSDLFD